MGWIFVEKCNFTEPRSQCEFSEGAFTFAAAAREQAIKMSASQITFLNKPPNRGRINASTDTNVFKYVFYMGTFLAIFAEFFRVFGAPKSLKPKRKQNTKIIVQFKDDKAFSGKTDLNTFFAIQNAWLDTRSNRDSI